MDKLLRLSETVGGGYDRFWRDKSRYRVLKGGKGSKKSATAALNFIYRLMKYPGANLLVVRQVMNTHRDSTFAQLKWAQERLGAGGLWKNTVSPMEMTYLPTGQKILFRGFDDVLKLASTTVEEGSLCWVWIEEAFELASEDDFDKLDTELEEAPLSSLGGEIRLPGKAADVLVCGVASYIALSEGDDLMQAVWSEEYRVRRTALSKAAEIADTLPAAY